MKHLYRCAQCGLQQAVKNFNPYIEDGILVRPDTCTDCLKATAQVRKAHPVNIFLLTFRLLERSGSRDKDEPNLRGEP